MLQKLVDFFKNLFSGLFGGSKKTSPPPPVVKKDTTPPKQKEPVTDPTPPTDPITDPIVIETPDPVIEEPVDEPIDDDDDEVIPGGTPTDISDASDLVDEPTVRDTIVTTPVEVPVVIDTPPVIEEPTEVTPAHKARYLWCLDNGHGKKTAGKRSPKLPNGQRLYEYEFNRDIVGRIIKKLDHIGVQTFNVVPETDIDNFLEGRVSRANQRRSNLPKLFVSVHANAAPAPPGKWSNPNISGIETWFFHNSSRGRRMATIFQKHLVNATGWKNRFIKSQPTRQFYVLKKTSMTAVLTENGFYNNFEQCQELFKDEVRQKIADAHVRAILEIEEKGI